MKRTIVQWAVVAACVGVAVPAYCADDSSSKVLPTLLIKGDVVSVDTSDASATLLKVKDRYGFETPIYLTPETTITQSGQTVAVTDLQTGAAVEVEYNFDINTAKRHAVTIGINASIAAPAAASVEPATTEGAAAPEATAVPDATTPAAESETAPVMAMPESAPAEAPAAAAAPDQPAETKTQ